MNIVAISSNTSWYLYNFRAATIRALIDRGYQVVCLSPMDEYSARLESELGCQWLPLHMDNQGNNPLKDAWLVYQFWRHYRRIRPAAVCHFTIKNNVYGTWAAHLLKIPAINTVTGLGTAFVRSGPVSKIVRLLYKSSQRFAHRIFCQNEEDKALLLADKLVPADRVRLIPGSGVNLDRFQSRYVARGPGRPFHFLYAGRMLVDKGLVELKQAMQQLNGEGHDCILWLCGFADSKNVSALSEQQLNQWSQQAWVEWLGPCDNMEDIYAQVDCVVLPSYREGIPRSLLEAGAMRLPVITTDVPGCRTVVRDGYNGLLCQPGSAAALAGAMKKMMSISRDERKAMGENGRTLVEAEYDESLVVDATLDAIESATVYLR